MDAKNKNHTKLVNACVAGDTSFVHRGAGHDQEKWLYPVGRALLMNERSPVDQQIAAIKAVTTAAIIARTTISNSIATMTHNCRSGTCSVSVAASLKQIRDGRRRRRNDDAHATINGRVLGIHHHLSRFAAHVWYVMMNGWMYISR